MDSIVAVAVPLSGGLDCKAVKAGGTAAAIASSMHTRINLLGLRRAAREREGECTGK